MNKDEALRAKDLAEDLMKKTNFTAARKLVLKAQNMDPSLEKNIFQMKMVCDVHCAAAEKLFQNDEMDWYGILQVDLDASDVIIKKQYKSMALLLHPDKNKLPNAESAFRLINEAHEILSDKDKRRKHDRKRIHAPTPAYTVISSSDSEDAGSNGGQPPRRSGCSKRETSKKRKNNKSQNTEISDREFTIVSILKSQTKQLAIPQDFVKRYIPDKNARFTIHKENTKTSWNVYLGMAKNSTCFNRGWVQLVRDYPILVGKSYTFELIKPTVFLLKKNTP